MPSKPNPTGAGERSYIIAVDSGGTFADCVVMDDAGNIVTSKAHTTPHDFSIGILNSVQYAAEELGLSLEQLLERNRYFFGHGSTVAINALVTRSGVKTGLVTTRGFEDTIIIGRVEQKIAGLSEAERFQVYRLNKADPIVPRPLIKGVVERIDYGGDVVTPLDREDVAAQVDALVAQGVEAIAVCLLWSFMNPRHEQAVQAIIRERHPHIFVSLSSELVPVLREYERTATTAINAYLSPITSRYLSSLNRKLKDHALARPLLVMQNIGGMVEASEASHLGVNLLNSGPVGGVLGSKILGDLKGHRNIITTDVGGTTFDVSLIVDGRMFVDPAPVVSQYNLLTPVIDIVSLGAGGGSIARVEPETGLLKVGPRSAGAVPGPVCYDQGGTEPTFTDAAVVLGRLDPQNFLGGRMQLNREAARRAIQDRVAAPLGISVEAAALGIVDILTAQMADLVRKTTIDNGFDPADFVLYAFGGAGPLCCCSFARQVSGIRQVVIPTLNSVFSAFGIGGSDIVRVERTSNPMLAPFDPARLNAIYRRMEDKLVGALSRNNVAAGDMTLVRSIDLRYWGQVHEVSVPVPAGEITAEQAAALAQSFVERYEAKYGRGISYGAAQLEAVNFEVTGTGRLEKPSLRRLPRGSGDAAVALKGRRPVWFDNDRGFVDTEVYVRERLEPGHCVRGPAVIEAVDTTVLVEPGLAANVDEYLNLVLDL